MHDLLTTPSYTSHLLWTVLQSHMLYSPTGILGVWVAYSSVMVKKNVLIGLRIASLPALIWDLSPVVTPVATLCASERMQRTWAHLQSTMSVSITHAHVTRYCMAA